MLILNELKEYTKEHFADEQEYMEAIHYEGLSAQKRAHEAFIDKLENIDLNQIYHILKGYQRISQAGLPCQQCGKVLCALRQQEQYLSNNHL